MLIKSVKAISNLRSKKVLLRIDCNVPIKNGVIQDEYKIIEQLPTINYLLTHNAKIILVTHLGEPKPGEIAEKYSIKPIAAYLGKKLDKKIKIINGFLSFRAGTIISQMKNKDIVMLENIRFYEGELKNNSAFAKQLAQLANIYVNDAFAVSHREQASVSAIKKFLPAYGGLLLEKEVKNLNKALHPIKPLVAIVGGMKISTKINLLHNLIRKGATVLIGGALANNFLAAHGLPIGRSLVDQASIASADRLKNKKQIIIPVDVIVGTSQSGSAKLRNIKEVGKNEYIFDIGPKTISLYAAIIKRAQTLIWNGPMGFFEVKEFSHGTMAIARLVASRSSGRAFGVVGGGETVEALKRSKMWEYVDWVSTGGGAMLAYLGGEKMPGLKGIIK